MRCAADVRTRTHTHTPAHDTACGLAALGLRPNNLRQPENPHYSPRTPDDCRHPSRVAKCNYMCKKVAESFGGFRKNV